MKDSRIGESLWEEWCGLGYDNALPDSNIFYTVDHVSLENDLVRKALASVVQRDGLFDSLADGFKAIEDPVITHGWAGYIDIDPEISVCDETGVTDYGDEVDEIKEITWVEF